MAGVFAFLQVRRRAFLVRVLAVLTFFGVACLWLKSEHSTNRLTREEHPAFNEVAPPPPSARPPLPAPVEPMEGKALLGSDIEERLRAEKLFAADDAMIVPGLGEGGRSVQLRGAEAEQANEVMKVEAFNRVLSDKISYNRSVPDSRDPL